MICEKIETFGFMFLESKQSKLIKLEGLGLECRDKDYFFDNKNRAGTSYLFQYTLSGVGMLTVNGKEYTVKKNEGFFVKLPSDTSYGLTQAQDEWSFMWVIISGVAADSIYNEIYENYGNLFYLKEDSSAIAFLRHMYLLSKNNQVNQSFFSQELAFSFLCRLSDSLSSPEEKLSELVLNAKNIVKTEYGKLQGVSDIAQRLKVSQEHLSRTFRRETGEQIIDFLTKTRLNHSVELLREKKFNLDDIAQICGFSSGNYFGKVFKRYVGISPRTFQNDPVYSKYSNIVIFN